MPMTEARAGDLKHGFAEECGCVLCRNFAAQRDCSYPASFRELLEQIGVDADQEVEAFEDGPPAPAYRGLPHLAIEFTADLPWVLSEPPKYRTASKDTRPR